MEQGVYPKKLLTLVTVVTWGACSAQPAPVSPTEELLEPDAIIRFAGEVVLPDDKHFEFLVILVNDPVEAGGFLGTIDVPRQALHGVSLVGIHYEPAKELRFSLPMAGEPQWRATFEGAETTSCQFKQGEHLRTCTLSMVTGKKFKPFSTP